MIKPKERWIVYRYTMPKEISGNKIDKYYIGITKMGVKKRAGRNGRYYRYCTAFYNAIQKYGYESFKVEVLHENLTMAEAVKLETEEIEKHKSTNPHYGYNIFPSSEGVADHMKTPVVQYDKDGNFVRVWESQAEASREYGNIHLELNGLYHNYYWRHFNPDGTYSLYIEPPKRQRRTVAIRQYNIDGTFVCDTTMVEAKEKYGNGVGTAVLKDNSSAYGYQWKYLDKDTPINIPPLVRKHPTHKNTSVFLYYEDGNFYKEYESVKAAFRGIGVKNGNLVNAVFDHICNNMRYGYRWTREYYDILPPLIPLSPSSNPMVQYKKDTMEITNIFVGAREAADSVGANNTANVCYCCNPNYKYDTMYGFSWAYFKDVDFNDFVISDEIAWKIKTIKEIQQTFERS